ncbi:MAG: ThuA domain-containing protein [Planctomycetaceae bacterium]
MPDSINVLVWNEFRHERRNDAVRAIYPDGIHAAIAEGLRVDDRLAVQTATLDEPEHGLTADVLARTDVLLWWGHVAHDEVSDAVVERVQTHVLEGLGLIVLHSGHFSKIFLRLMGTTGSLKWRVAAERERLWTIEPSHPIAEGVGECIELDATEMYGERFDIPQPETLVFLSWFEGGEVFRSGCTWQRGHGRIFYFRPGHETYPIYYNEQVRRVLRNAVHWVAPRLRRAHTCPNVKQPRSPIAGK